MEIGDIIEATVTSIEPYGIWFQAQGKRGLVLITDISHKRVSHPSEYAKIGDILTVKVIRFNGENGDVVASRKELHSEGKEETTG
jgi:small subunit ribosomal protein S1